MRGKQEWGENRVMHRSNIKCVEKDEWQEWGRTPAERTSKWAEMVVAEVAEENETKIEEVLRRMDEAYLDRAYE